MASEPLLPSELERSIFEMAALSHPGAIPALLRVARRVFIWIEPWLYRVARIDWHSPDLDAFKAALKVKPPSFFQGATRHLYLGNTMKWTEDEVVHALEICTNIEDLLLCGPVNLRFLTVIWAMRLRRFAGRIENLFGSRNTIDLTHPVFTSVTHLNVFDWVDQHDTHIISGLVAMPSLTHLSLDGCISWGVIETLLAESSRLRLLLLLYDGRGYEDAMEYAEHIPIHVHDDVRFVMMIYDRFIVNWEAAAAGKPNYWSYADDLIARRRAGVVDKSPYWLDHRLWDKPASGSIED